MRTPHLLVLAVLGLSTAGAVPAPELVMPWELVECPADPAVREFVEVFPDPTTPGGIVTVHALCYAPGAPSADTDCTSNAYKLTGWDWSGSYSAKVDPDGSGLGASGVLSAFGSSGSTWDQATSGAIWGGVTQNSNGAAAGKKDNVNQFGWKNGGGSTIAVTYTWSSGGNAVESDAKYNKQYAWSLSGEANKMDLQNIATHEIGHTYGIDHPTTNAANECLTMYAYADYGETKKRTLGDGDISAIKALYG
jgi:hypothetical protein